MTPERRIRNEAENRRFFQAIKALFDNQEPLRRLVNMVIDEYLKKTGQAGRDALNKKLSYGTGDPTRQ